MWFVSTLRWSTAQFKPITVSLICQCVEKHTYFAYGTGELSAWAMRKHLIRREENRARDCSARCRSLGKAFPIGANPAMECNERAWTGGPRGYPGLSYRLVTDSGEVFSHCPVSVTPEASCAQALVMAVRTACWKSLACALRQSRCPRNTIQTSTPTLSPSKVVETTKSRKTTTKAIAIQTVFFMRRSFPCGETWRNGAPRSARGPCGRVHSNARQGPAGGIRWAHPDPPARHPPPRE